MKQRLIVVAAALALHPAVARADGGPFGLGIIVGNPTGITGAYKLGGNTALDGAVGVGGFDFDGLYIHVDFLFLLPNLVNTGSVRLSPYVGPGGFLTVGGGDNSGSGSSGSGGGSKGTGLGVRVPFGLSLDFRSFPLQLFIEIAPQLEVVPDPDFGLGGAVGFRSRALSWRESRSPCRHDSPHEGGVRVRHARDHLTQNASEQRLRTRRYDHDRG